MRRPTWILIALAAGCGGSPEPVAPRASVLLLTIDSLRYEHVGAAGHVRETTPTLDRIAREGTFFSRCYAQASWTLPSMVSLITSRSPYALGVDEGARTDPETGRWIAGGIGPEALTLTEAFRAAGWTTAGFSSNAHLDVFQGFDQGFETFEAEPLRRKDAGPVLAAAERWLASDPEEPFFLWVHLFDPHHQAAGHPDQDVRERPPLYVTPKGYEDVFPLEDGLPVEEATRRAYDRRVRAMDDALAKFLERLDQRGLLDEIVIAIAVDHGEEFFEDGRWGHSRSLRDSLVRVPMWIRLPGGARGGGVVDAVVRNQDLAPTLLELVDLPHPPSMEGRSLVALLGGDAPAGGAPVYGETRREGYQLHYWIDAGGGRKLVLDELAGTRALYDLRADPGETRDLAASEPDVADRLERELRAYLAATVPDARSDQTIDADAVDELRAMGYVGEDE